jgi:hypothetical protein
MIKPILLRISEIVLISIFMLYFHYGSYNIINDINICPHLQCAIAFYYLFSNLKLKGYIFLFVSDLLLGQILFANFIAYFIIERIYSLSGLDYKINNDILRFAYIILFIFLFLWVVYIITSLYYSMIFNYSDILLQITTTSLMFPLIEKILILFDQ